MLDLLTLLDEKPVGAPAFFSLSPVTVKGGVSRVIDSATGDIARTTSGFVEDEKYGWYAIPAAGTTSFEFDSAVTRTGRLTLKLTTTSAAGRGRFLQGGNLDSGVASTEAIVKKFGTPITAGRSYRLRCYAKTDSVASNSVYLDFGAWTAAGAIVNVTGSTTNKLTGTNDWTLLTSTFTAPATSVYGAARLFVNVAGDAQQAWFDVNSMTLEEVSTITNPGTVSAYLYPKFTAVTSTDNIDQAQSTQASAQQIGNQGGTNRQKAQQFLPTKKNFTGVKFYKGSSVGTPTGNLVFEVVADNANVPSNTVLATKTYTLAEWNALSTGLNTITFNTNLTLTIDGSTKYWIKAYSTNPSESTDNYYILGSDGTGSYTGGLLASSSNAGSTWSTVTNNDLTFQTLYSKNSTNFTVATDTQTLSYTAPTPDGWPNGTILNSSDLGLTPLKLAPGVNNIYYSSNGPATADGTVDPSLQGTIGKV
jgi:hypothetical protein